MGTLFPKFFTPRSLGVVGPLLIAVLVFGQFIVPPQAQVAAYDVREVKLSKYLKSVNSPLAEHASTFVREADKNALDYRLLPAIAGVESTFARNYIITSHNAYGWGGGKIYFQSWEEGIAKISNDLKTKYVDRGADTVEKISWIYCPPGNLIWAAKVRYFMNKIEETEVEVKNDFLATALPLTL